MVIPHIIDQFIWNDILANLRVGPKGMRIDSLNKPELEGKIDEMWYNPEFKQKAKEVAENMSKEDFSEELYKELV